MSSSNLRYAVQHQPLPSQASTSAAIPSSTACSIMPYPNEAYPEYQTQTGASPGYVEQQVTHLENTYIPVDANFIPTTTSYDFMYHDFQTTTGGNPELEIIEQPFSMNRYRYASESGSHGRLIGEHSTDAKKTFPTVKLKNFSGDESTIFIRASLYTAEADPRPHFHKLTCKSNIGFCDVPLKNGVAVFQNLSILFVGRKEVVKQIVSSHLQMSPGAKAADVKKLTTEAQKEASKINLHRSRICFEAFQNVVINGVKEPRLICGPVFSIIILNQKSTETGELKICRIDKVSGVCTGNEEIYLLCEKVDKKNIKIRFFESDEYGNLTWEDFGRFNEADVHKQVAIVFRTPAYKDRNIQQDVPVYLQLFRPKDGTCSKKQIFTFTPAHLDSEELQRKRRKVDHFPEDFLSSASFQPFEAGNSPSTDTNRTSEGQSQYGSDISQQQYRTASSYKTSDESLSDDSLCSFDPLWCFPNIFVDGDISTSNNITSKFEKLKLESQKTTVSTNSSKVTIEAGHVTRKDQKRILIEDLHTCCISGRLVPFNNMLRYFVHVPNKDGNNCLHLAILHHPEKIENIQQFLSVLDEANRKCINDKNLNQQTPLHLALTIPVESKMQARLVQMLLTNGADPTIKNGQGNTAHHLAVMANEDKVLDLILKACDSSNLNELNYNGFTAMHLSIIENSEECFKLLLKANANINAIDGTAGRTPLHLAVEYQQENFLKLLLQQANIEVDNTNYSGNTALHLACIVKNATMVKLLMEADANPLIETGEQTPWECAEDNETIKSLLAGDSTLYYNELAASIKPVEGLENFREKNEVPIDSGFISGEIESSLLSSDALNKLCRLLDPPNRDWEKLAFVLGYDETVIKNICLIAKSPTQAILHKYEENGGSLVCLEIAMEAANLKDAATILKNMV